MSTDNESTPPGAHEPEVDATVIRPRSARTGMPTAAVAAAAFPSTEIAAAAPSPSPPTEALGRPAAAGEGGNMLPVGTCLAEFEITQVIGEGGFGIVYLAEDRSLHRRVALKEYMPSSLAARVGATQVSVKSERHRETFEAGLKSFVNEARLLAQFDHPSLVKVYRFWEANGTAYMVMPFYEGTTLKDELKAMGHPPDEPWLRELLEPLSEALAVIHAEQCFHRDIAPDNVILLKGSGLPLLLDFGAARRVIGDMTQALTVILKPGYAPVEQYAEVPGMKQGAWTDVYALAAVVHYAVQGKTPPTSVGRLMNDNIVPMARAGAGRYSPGFLAAIDHALAVKPEERTQSIDQLRRELGMAGGGVAEAEKTQRRARAVAASEFQTLEAAKAPVAKSRGPMLVGAVLVLAVVVAGGYALFGRSSGVAPTVAPSTTTAVVPPTTVGVTPPATTAAPVVEADARPAVTDASAAVAGVTPIGAARGELDPLREMERVSAAQSPDFKVFAATDRPALKINRDKLTFQVKSEKEGHLYVFMHGSDGTLIQLFPNQAAKNNKLRADTALSLPPPKGNWDLAVGGPAGTDHLLAIVSTHPREFAGLGLKVRDGFAQTTVAAVKAAALTHTGKASVFAGTPICPSSCSDEFGAALFTVEEIP